MTNGQREAIEKLEYVNRWYDCNNYYSRYELDCIDTVLSLIKEQEEQLEKKDKQIDLMANCILAREIGKMTCQFNEKCTKYENGRDIHCKDCIKQYFADLVEKEN